MYLHINVAVTIQVLYENELLKKKLKKLKRHNEELQGFVDDLKDIQKQREYSMLGVGKRRSVNRVCKICKQNRLCLHNAKVGNSKSSSTTFSPYK